MTEDERQEKLKEALRLLRRAEYLLTKIFIKCALKQKQQDL